MKTLVGLAKELKISPTTLRSAAEVGKFPVQKTGRDLLINEDSVEFKSWLEKHLARVEKNRP